MAVELITETNPMQKAMNKSLAVAYINRDINNYVHSIDTSWCFYDEDKDFANLMLTEVGSLSIEQVLRVVEDKTKGRIRYYSKGIV